MNGPTGERCGRVVGEGTWKCHNRPVTPGEVFPLGCTGAAADGAVIDVSVQQGTERRWAAFVPVAAGLYEFHFDGEKLKFDRVAETCPAPSTP